MSGKYRWIKSIVEEQMQTGLIFPTAKQPRISRFGKRCVQILQSHHYRVFSSPTRDPI